ncbi:MAG: VanW family protein [Clostridiales bacterium]|jgi:vancomycin resistance protein YoaR|nr:VanW family protein [Clostridiales bacterium]
MIKRLALIAAAIVFIGGCGQRSDSMIDSVVEAAQPSTEKLSEFTTEFKNAEKARAHNITMAAKAIDEKIVNPGETFSFNDSVGPTTKANGFMLGKIFSNGKNAKGYGGGVCQVSSTLFNAADAIGLEIVERHKHSKSVNYVEKGRDATVSHGVIDFKFANNKSYPVRIDSFANGESVTIALYKA